MTTDTWVIGPVHREIVIAAAKRGGKVELKAALERAGYPLPLSRVNPIDRPAMIDICSTFCAL